MAFQLQIERALLVYGTIVAFEIYEDPETHEFFIKLASISGKLLFAGHNHDVFTPIGTWKRSRRLFWPASNRRSGAKASILINHR